MTANLQANHQIISITRRLEYIGESKLNPIIIPTSLFQERRCFKARCVSEKSSRNSVVVEQRPSNEDLEMMMMMIDHTVEVDDMIEYLVREYGWKVRRMVEDMNEMKKVALIQAQAFHDPSPFLDEWFFQFFQAEVLAGLLYRLRHSPPDRYACLVAEPAKQVDKENSAQYYEPQGADQQLVGVVDVTVLRDNDVLHHLEADEYLYVSGIAVCNNFRRQKVATVLLKACEVIAVLWGYEYLVLRAYEDDWGARSLYSNAGFRVVARDPVWVTLIGRKRRVLMAKQVC